MALSTFDYRAATAAVWAIAAEANRLVNRIRPWELAKAERSGAGPSTDLDACLGALLGAGQALGRELSPFLPDAAGRISAQCAPGSAGHLPVPCPVFRRLAPRPSAGTPR